MCARNDFFQFIKMTDQLRKATDNVVLDYLKEYMRQQLKDNPEQHIQDENVLNIIKTINENRKNKKEKEKSNYVFITINPSPDSSLEKFVSTVHKSVTKKWVTYYLYSFEQRGTLDNDYCTGHHCHMLLYREGKRPSEIAREFRNTFKSFIGNPQHVNIKYISDKDVEKVTNYIKGIKKDEDKQEKIEADIAFRKLMGLQPYYEHLPEEVEEEVYSESE